MLFPLFQGLSSGAKHMLWAKSCIDVFCMKDDEYKMGKQGTRKCKLTDVKLGNEREKVCSEGTKFPVWPEHDCTVATTWSPEMEMTWQEAEKESVLSRNTEWSVYFDGQHLQVRRPVGDNGGWWWREGEW